MIRTIGLEDIEHLALGSAFLGTGGGGDPYIGSLLCREAISQHGKVAIIDPASLDDAAAVFVAAAMGAPTVMIEKLFSIEDQHRAVHALERHLSRPATAIISAEIGGCNSMMPVAYAAMRNLPLVDGDGMGRAFPELQMTSFNVNGVAVAPMTLGDEHGNIVLFETADGKKAEELARPVVAAMGAAGVMSCYPMTGEQARRATVPGTISAAIMIGRTIDGAVNGALPPVERLLTTLRQLPLYGAASCVFSGKIMEVERNTRDGWVIGSCRIGALQTTEQANIIFQNENLSVEVDGQLQCIVPDLITIVDSETGHAIPTERLAYGQRVSVVACRAPSQLTSPRALAIMGPHAFGIEKEYEPIGSQINKGKNKQMKGAGNED